MRKVFVILLISVLSITLAGCKKTVEKDAVVNFENTLKVLTIGNSFGIDANEYLYKIADDYGVDEIILGILYIPGASLETHVDSFTEDLTNYIYYKNTDDKWTCIISIKLVEGLIDEDWDIITLQQVSSYSGVQEKYNENLTSLLDIIDSNKTNQNSQVVWHMTWAYQENSTHSGFVYYSNDQMTMYEAITDAAQAKIDTRDDIDYVIPTGTTIQNLRTSYIGDNLTVDGYHLSIDKGRFAAALTWFSKITGLPIDGITYKPDGVTEQDLLNIKEAVNNAIASPYTVTNSSFLVDNDE